LLLNFCLAFLDFMTSSRLVLKYIENLVFLLFKLNIDGHTHTHTNIQINISISKWKTHRTCLFLWLQLLWIEAVEQQGQEQVEHHEVPHYQSG